MLFPQQPRPGIPFPQVRPPLQGGMPMVRCVFAQSTLSWAAERARQGGAAPRHEILVGAGGSRDGRHMCWKHPAVTLSCERTFIPSLDAGNGGPQATASPPACGVPCAATVGGAPATGGRWCCNCISLQAMCCASSTCASPSSRCQASTAASGAARRAWASATCPGRRPRSRTSFQSQQPC